MGQTNLGSILSAKSFNTPVLNFNKLHNFFIVNFDANLQFSSLVSHFVIMMKASSGSLIVSLIRICPKVDNMFDPRPTLKSSSILMDMLFIPGHISNFFKADASRLYNRNRIIRGTETILLILKVFF